MSKLFTCDNCKKTFTQPLDEVMYKDEHGQLYVLDFCAPCRVLQTAVIDTAKKEYFDKIIKKEK